MEEDFDLILDHALELLEQGVPLEDCLARYPRYAKELAPLLRTARVSAEVLGEREIVSLPALAAGRERLLQAAAARRTPLQELAAWWRGRWGRDRAPQPRYGLRPLPLALSLLVVVVLVLGGSMAIASADSLPGDGLYPVKRVMEQIRLSLAVAPEARAQLQRDLEEERRDEAYRVMTLGRQLSVQFDGRLEQMDSTGWLISGLAVQLRSDTELRGQMELGVHVHVHAEVRDNVLLARQIIVVEKPGRSVGQTPVPSEPTHALTPTHPPEPTHAPTATWPPEPTHAPTATWPPEPTHAPTATWPPEPTHAPTATWPPEPTHAPTATWPPEPTHAPTATWPPEPTHAPTATWPPEPTNHPTRSPEPTWPPEPTHAATPTWPPEPTHVPTATWPPEPTHAVTPTPTWPPEPTHAVTPTPTWPPEPTHVPTATWPPEPTHVPTATWPPEPTHAPTATWPPEPTHAATPTPTVPHAPAHPAQPNRQAESWNGLNSIWQVPLGMLAQD